MIQQRLRNTKRKTIVIQVTENCNLKCNYCYQTEKRHESIKSEILTRIIFDSLNSNDEFDEIEFDFIGGEPLLCFSLIKETCELVWNKCTKKPCIFFITTNGTLLDENAKKWLTKNKDKIWLGLSIDGTKDMHNRNRCDSFDLIDISFFLNNWIEQPVKMTISTETLSNFAEGVIFLHQLGFKVAANLAYGINWSNLSNETNLEKELFKLINFYLSNPKIEPIMLLNLPLYNLMSNNIEKYCGANTEMEAFDIKGKRFPCHMFYNVTIGNENWKNIDCSMLYKNYYQNCKNQKYFNICPICVGINFSQTDIEYKCDESLCKLMIQFFKANAFFQAKRILKSHPLGQNTYQMRETINAIRNINQTLNK